MPEGNLTEKLMANFQKPRQTKEFEATNEIDFNLFKQYRMVAADDSESSFDSEKAYRIKDKRWAKESHVLRAELIDFFRERGRDLPTWDDVKHAFSDQPEAPLKQALLEVSDKTGTGSQARFSLKSSLVM